MAKGLLTDINLADAAELSGGTWALPLSNLKDRRMVARPARSNPGLSPADTQFTATLSDTRRINFISLLFHTMSRNAEIRLRLKNAADEIIHDGGWEPVHTRVYPTRTLEWEMPNFWDGRPLEQNLRLYPNSFYHVLTPSKSTKSVEIEISDPTHPDGFFDIGYLFIAGSWSPKFNYSFGREIRLSARDRVETALSGHEVSEYRRPQRHMSLQYGDLDKTETMNILDMRMRSGTSRPIIFIPDIDDKTHLIREAFLATFETLDAHRFNFETKHSTTLSLKEIMR